MAKVTSKLQVTVPKAVADRFGIAPGDDIEWQPAGDVIRVVPARRRTVVDVADRARLFDQATKRQKARQARRSVAAGAERGWSRDQLYERGRAR